MHLARTPKMMPRWFSSGRMLSRACIADTGTRVRCSCAYHLAAYTTHPCTHTHTHRSCLQPRQNNDLVHNNPISHEVQKSYRGTLQLVFGDDPLADGIHEAEVPVDCVDAPDSQNAVMYPACAMEHTQTAARASETVEAKNKQTAAESQLPSADLPTCIQAPHGVIPLSGAPSDGALQAACHHAHCCWNADKLFFAAPRRFQRLESFEHEHPLLGISLLLLRTHNSSHWSLCKI